MIFLKGMKEVPHRTVPLIETISFPIKKEFLLNTHEHSCIDIPAPRDHIDSFLTNRHSLRLDPPDNVCVVDTDVITHFQQTEEKKKHLKYHSHLESQVRLTRP